MRIQITTSLVAVLLLAGAAASSLVHAQTARQPQVLLQAAMHQELVEGDLERAIRMYNEIVADGAVRAVTAKALLYLGRSYEKLGSTEALNVYRRLASDYGDQGEFASVARARLAAIDAAEKPLEDRGIVIRQVWGRIAGSSSVSRDGRYISFVDWVPAFGGDSVLRGHADLAVYDTETGKSRLITDSPSLNENDSYVTDAVFSPSGNRLAYTLQSSDGTEWTWQLHVVDADGRNDRTILRNGEWRFVQTADWSPTGDFLLVQFESWDRTIRLATVSLDDGSLTVIKTLGRHFAVRPFNLSPDGKYVVYDNLQADGDQKHDVFVIATDGSSEGRLVSGPADEDRPLWAPDGEHVVFVSDRSGRRSLWAVKVSDGVAVSEPELIRPDIGTMNPLGFDARGTLYYTVTNRENHVYVAVLDADRLGMAGEPLPVTDRYLGTNERAVWSPDGTRMAYVSSRGPGAIGDPRVVIRSLDTGEEREYAVPFAEPSRWNIAPRWSASGAHISLHGQDAVDAIPGTHRLRLDTGEWTRERYLRDMGGRSRMATDRQIDGLRANGVRIPPRAFRLSESFEGTDERLLGVFERGVFLGTPGRDYSGVDFDSPHPEGVTALFRTLHIHSWDLSPDGTRLAIASAEDSTRTDSLVSRVMRVMPVAGGEAVEVFRTPNDGEILSTRWTPDSKALLLAVGSTDDESLNVIWYVPVDGRNPVRTRFRFDSNTLRFMDFRSDGDRIVFGTRDQWGEIWAMEGFPWTEAPRP